MIDRWKCESYCLCKTRKGHFEKSDEGVWVLYSDMEALLKRQAAAALSGMDAAKKISSVQLDLARKARAESASESLASERAANAKLTQELSLAEEGLASYAQENRGLKQTLREILDELQLDDTRHDLQAKIILAIGSPGHPNGDE